MNEYCHVHTGILMSTEVSNFQYKIKAAGPMPATYTVYFRFGNTAARVKLAMAEREKNIPVILHIFWTLSSEKV